MTRPAPIPCSRFFVCGKNATKERLDPRAKLGSDTWAPVCAEHAKGATPFELRDLRARRPP
jgi:hypothetical protein